MRIGVAEPQARHFPDLDAVEMHFRTLGQTINRRVELDLIGAEILVEIELDEPEGEDEQHKCKGKCGETDQSSESCSKTYSDSTL